jgi:(p)ppGpp synthase/HD superfamily hydrolase
MTLMKNQSPHAPARARARPPRTSVSRRPPLGRRFEQALRYANRLHATQEKKGTGVPYMAHLLGVASIVLSHGGDEDLAIAALLHDGPEDQGGLAILKEIELIFGKRVADVVDACTDTYDDPKPEWLARKQNYIAGVRHKSADARLVVAADKLHNGRQVLEDHRQLGDVVFDRFKGKKDGTLWYYRRLVNELRQADSAPILDELERVVSELEHAAGAPPRGTL